MTWTIEREQLLEKLWMEGLSASQIAYVMIGFTRNAIIGKAHRLGLPKRAASPVAKNKESQCRAVPSLPKIGNQANHGVTEAQPPAGPLSNEVPANGGDEDVQSLRLVPVVPCVADAEDFHDIEMDDLEAFRIETIPGADTSDVKIMTLGKQCCKWPIGDPFKDDFKFCNRTAAAGKSYCEDHHRVAYQAPRRLNVAANDSEWEKSIVA